MPSEIYPPKEYIIAEALAYGKIWNNGLIEFHGGQQWPYQRLNDSPEKRLKFIELWKKCEIGKRYSFDYAEHRLDVRLSSLGYVFLGFREQCPECKKSNLIWEGKIQLCKGCGYIHAFEYDDN